MTNHTITTGTFEAGIKLLHETGGQLMPQRNPDSATVLVCGRNVTTLWPPKSRVRGLVTQVATQIGYDPFIATGGRICRYIADDILAIPYQDTFYSPRWQKLAQGGQHWHYLYANPGLYDYAIELDVKSAYWASFMTGKSTLMRGDGSWIDDGGKLGEFGILMNTLPKWLRVSMLGQFASWKSDFYLPDKTTEGGWGITLKTRRVVKTGALFNATHRAICRVWKFMQRLHQILGDDCLRIHTDGVIINCSNGMDWEQAVEDEFTKWGFGYTVKGFGHCWIHDVNSVVLGQKIAGSKRYIRDEMVRQGVKVDLRRVPPASHRWFDELPSSVETDVCMDPVAVETQTSLPLFVQPPVDLPHLDA